MAIPAIVTGDKMIKLIREILSDDTGKGSSARVIKLLFSLYFIAVHGYLCIEAGEWIQVPSDVLAILVSVLGLQLYQKVIETKKEKGSAIKED